MIIYDTRICVIDCVQDKSVHAVRYWCVDYLFTWKENICTKKYYFIILFAHYLLTEGFHIRVSDLYSAFLVKLVTTPDSANHKAFPLTYFLTNFYERIRIFLVFSPSIFILTRIFLHFRHMWLCPAGAGRGCGRCPEIQDWVFEMEIFCWLKYLNIWNGDLCVG